MPASLPIVIVGQKTRSVFGRYNIVSERKLREAATRLAGTISRTAPRVELASDGMNDRQCVNYTYGVMVEQMSQCKELTRAFRFVFR